MYTIIYLSAWDSDIPLLSGEPKSGGHVTITHQMLASIIQVFCVIILFRTDKRWLETLGKRLITTFRDILFSYSLASFWIRITVL